MGLDTVELVMSLEDAFGVSISDQEWARATTVGEAADLLVRELRKREGPGCRTMRVFHRVRRELKRAYGVERERVKLGTEIGILVPPGWARWKWARFASRNGLVVGQQFRW